MYHPPPGPPDGHQQRVLRSPFQQDGFYQAPAVATQQPAVTSPQPVYQQPTVPRKGLSGGYGGMMMPPPQPSPQAQQWQAPLTNPFGPSATTSEPQFCPRDGGGSPEDEAPLLEELGIVPKDILRRILCVLTFHNVGDELVNSMDMTGPVLILMALGCTLLLSGKVHFGHVYAMMTAGTLALWALLNMMSSSPSLLSIHRALSVFGYGLLPLLISSVVSPFLHRFKLHLVLGATLWSTLTASRFVDEALQMKKQRLLVAYPILLFYGCFALTL